MNGSAVPGGDYEVDVVDLLYEGYQVRHIWEALRTALVFQGQYAHVLNLRDGGRRVIFKVGDWMEFMKGWEARVGKKKRKARRRKG